MNDFLKIIGFTFLITIIYILCDHFNSSHDSNPQKRISIIDKLIDKQCECK